MGFVLASNSLLCCSSGRLFAVCFKYGMFINVCDPVSIHPCPVASQSRKALSLLYNIKPRALCTDRFSTWMAKLQKLLHIFKVIQARQSQS